MRKFAQRSERVKSVDLHPTEPWGIYPPPAEYTIHAERPNESLVEAFKNMHVLQEEVLSNENGNDAHEGVTLVLPVLMRMHVIRWLLNQDDAVEVEADGSTDGVVLVNGNDTEEQWGTNREEPSA
ncbi:hypothetical protein ABZP36_022198 [Zizania latifolia]